MNDRTMPDRAEVDERKESLQSADDSQSKPANPLQPSRALVALSDDHNWLVMLEPVDQVAMWGLFQRDWDDDQRPWVFASYNVVDTGQSAHTVLAAFLESRDA